MDVIEINEAFAAQTLAVMRGFGLSYADPRINAWGGAIALGHPLGATGTRLVTTAVNRLLQPIQIRPLHYVHWSWPRYICRSGTRLATSIAYD